MNNINIFIGMYFSWRFQKEADWDFEKAGKVPVCGKGMTWLQLIPDDKQRVITAKYIPEKKVLQGVEYPNSISVWYVDVIEGITYDPDGVAVFIDKYLDVIFTPVGDIMIDDREELDAAYNSGELSKEQYDAAIMEGDAIIKELCSDIVATEVFCSNILIYVNDKIEKGEKLFKNNLK